MSLCSFQTNKPLPSSTTLRPSARPRPTPQRITTTSYRPTVTTKGRPTTAEPTTNFLIQRQNNRRFLFPDELQNSRRPVNNHPTTVKYDLSFLDEYDDVSDNSIEGNQMQGNQYNGNGPHRWNDHRAPKFENNGWIPVTRPSSGPSTDASNNAWSSRRSTGNLNRVQTQGPATRPTFMETKESKRIAELVNKFEEEEKEKLEDYKEVGKIVELFNLGENLVFAP